jgi:hypothetical protein
MLIADTFSLIKSGHLYIALIHEFNITNMMYNSARCSIVHEGGVEFTS